MQGWLLQTVQVFTKSNNQWRAAAALTDAHVSGLQGGPEAETGVGEPVAHSSYLINLGSPDDARSGRSRSPAWSSRSSAARPWGSATWSCIPGAHVGQGEDAGLARVARRAWTRPTAGPGAWRLKVALETTAGQGTCLGHRFEHLGRIFELVGEPERLGVCVDTCHIFAAGYPLATDSEYDGTMADLERAVGTGRVRVWHLNDSLKPLGSRVDRHAGIGLGHLGIEPFRHVVNDPRYLGLPMILETPKGVSEDGEDLDAVNLRVLRQLLTTETTAATGSRE